MTQTITYYSDNASGDMTWLAYVILPDGKPWMVFGHGETEEAARNKIVSLYEKEAAKFAKKDKKRVDSSEQAALEWLGYKRGGPRS